MISAFLEAEYFLQHHIISSPSRMPARRESRMEMGRETARERLELAIAQQHTHKKLAMSLVTYILYMLCWVLLTQDKKHHLH